LTSVGALWKESQFIVSKSLEVSGIRARGRFPEPSNRVVVARISGLGELGSLTYWVQLSPDSDGRGYYAIEPELFQLPVECPNTTLECRWNVVGGIDIAFMGYHSQVKGNQRVVILPANTSITITDAASGDRWAGHRGAGREMHWERLP
jgi:hypothetical protein